MRISIWIGLVTLALGIFLSYLADAMIQTQATGIMQTTASLFATILYLVFSASMLGTGAALVIHWILGFAKHWKTFIAEIILSFATFFTGLGATIMSDNWLTGLQIFLTFTVASMMLVSLSAISLFGGVMEGLFAAKKYISKKFKKK